MKPLPRPAMRRLLPLAALVLAVHLLLLDVAPGPLVLAPPATAAQPFITRTVAAAPEPAAVPATTPTMVQRPVRSLHAAQSAQEHSPELNVAAKVNDNAPVPAALVEPIALAGPPSSQEAPAPAGTRATALSIPGSMRLHYTVTASVRGVTLMGQGELVWRHDNQNYEASLEVSAPLLPKRTQSSTGRITPDGLAPLRFSDKARSEQAAHFERDKGKVSFSNNQPDAPLLPGAQDRLSVLLQLGALIAGDPQQFRPAATISIQTAGTHDAEPWLFTVEREEDLQLPGGTVHALKLTRNPRRQFDQKVELWLAPAQDYVPVRLRLTQPNGDSVDQQWSSTDRG